MPIKSYFYDSVAGDRPYSATDFANAFGIITKTGIIVNDDEGDLGFDIGGTNYNTIFAGKATIEGHFVELTETETLTVPIGSYSGMIVIRVDITDERTASIVVRTDQTPIQDNSMFEFPLYNCTVSNGVITAVTDLRVQGGAVAKTASNVVTWGADPNGVYINFGNFAGTGKPIKCFLITGQPSPNPNEHRLWIQIDNF